ncbi:MAG: crossover junction endodeoxyribonuclease RuvC [Patescibacteria group bacterium]|nr:crossover junction endodeoxyribonuclease RuvC [Patescibacteria group bacterium]
MDKKEQIILGLDPGLADVGYGLIKKKGQELAVVSAGLIKTGKEKDFSRRLQEIYQAVFDLLQRDRPDLVAVEKIFFAKNTKTALAVAQARGAILLAIRQAKIDLLEFTPLQVKQAVCANGRAPKNQVGLMVKTLLKLKQVPKSDDVADALAVALCASFFNKKLT